jgi:hypothetical protein
MTAKPAAPSHKYPPHPLYPVLMGGTINLLAGAPGTGKSTFIAWLAKQIQDKTPLWGRHWGEVPWQGIICADRSWERSTKLWFDVEGMGGIPAYSLQDDAGFKKARLRVRAARLAIFESCLDALSPKGNGEFPLGALVYVDPLALFLGGNLLDYDTCLVACSELRELCLARGITIIGTAHASKQKTDKGERYLRLQDRILGSTALFGYTDTQMYIASPEEIERAYYVFLWHPHHAPRATFEFTRNKVDGRFLPGKEIIESYDGTVIDIPGWLSSAFDVGPRSLSQLLQTASEQQPPVSRATLMRRLQHMISQGIVFQPKYGEYAKVNPS